MKKMNYFVRILVFLLILSNFIWAASGGNYVSVAANLMSGGIPKQDLSLRWFVKESEFFRIIFPIHLRQTAEFINAEAEDVYTRLYAWTKYEPEEKIDIVVTDINDFANGYVALGPGGFYITVYTVYPYGVTDTGIDAYKNWYKNLLIHELSHFFHLDIVKGGPAVIKKIFGNIFYPNLTVPPFYKEGFAVYSETVNEYGFGRGNSSYTRMYIRTASIEDNFITLDRASNDLKVWPLGQASYLFGVSFVNYLSREYGEDKLTDFNMASGSYPIFMWGLAFNNVYGRRISKIWHDWEQAEQKNQREAADKIKEEKETIFEPVGKMKGYVYSVSISRSGRQIAYSINPVDRLGGLYIYDIEREAEKCVKKGLYVKNIQFSGDDKKIYYIRYEIKKNVYVKNNIYVFDLNSKKERQITKSGSIQGFVLLEEKDLFLTCYSTPGGTSISLVDLNGKVKKTLKPDAVKLKNNQSTVPVIEEPSLSPETKLVAFSCKDDRGVRSLFLASLEDLMEGECDLDRITGSNYNAYSPVWLSSDELMFIGDENGVYNIYKINFNAGTTERITNVLTGVFAPAVSGNGEIALKEYTSQGFRISTGTVYGLDHLYREEKHTVSEKPTFRLSDRLDIEDKSGFYTIEGYDRYRPAKWLIPGYWLPFMVGNGVNLGVGFYTSGNDILMRHSYSTGLVYDLFDNKFKSVINYTYNTYPFSYFSSLFLSQDAGADVFSPGYAFYPGISFPLIRSALSFHADLGVILEDPYTGPNLFMRFSNTKSPINWIGPERGFTFIQGVYYNSGAERFAVVSDYFSIYFKPFNIALLNFEIQSKGEAGTADNRIKSGIYNKHVYIPLNGVYTMGYNEPIAGVFVLDFKTTLGFPILKVFRGFQTLPLFFEGMTFNLFNDNGLVAATDSPYNFVVTDMSDFAQNPRRYVRSSFGAELEMDFIIGYEMPFAVQIGYVHTVSEGGRNGIYVLFKSDVQF